MTIPESNSMSSVNGTPKKQKSLFSFFNKPKNTSSPSLLDGNTLEKNNLNNSNFPEIETKKFSAAHENVHGTASMVTPVRDRVLTLNLSSPKPFTTPFSDKRKQTPNGNKNEMNISDEEEAITTPSVSNFHKSIFFCI